MEGSDGNGEIVFNFLLQLPLRGQILYHLRQTSQGEFPVVFPLKKKVREGVRLNYERDGRRGDKT